MFSVCYFNTKFWRYFALLSSILLFLPRKQIMRRHEAKYRHTDLLTIHINVVNPKIFFSVYFIYLFFLSRTEADHTLSPLSNLLRRPISNSLACHGIAHKAKLSNFSLLHRFIVFIARMLDFALPQSTDLFRITLKGAFYGGGN